MASHHHACLNRTDKSALSTGDHLTPLAVCQFVRSVKECDLLAMRHRPG